MRENTHIRVSNKELASKIYTKPVKLKKFNNLLRSVKPFEHTFYRRRELMKKCEHIAYQGNINEIPLHTH